MVLKRIEDSLKKEANKWLRSVTCSVLGILVGAIAAYLFGGLFHLVFGDPVPDNRVSLAKSDEIIIDGTGAYIAYYEYCCSGSDSRAVLNDEVFHMLRNGLVLTSSVGPIEVEPTTGLWSYEHDDRRGVSVATFDIHTPCTLAVNLTGVREMEALDVTLSVAKRWPLMLFMTSGLLVFLTASFFGRRWVRKRYFDLSASRKPAKLQVYCTSFLSHPGTDGVPYQVDVAPRMMTQLLRHQTSTPKSSRLSRIPW